MKRTKVSRKGETLTALDIGCTSIKLCVGRFSGTELAISALVETPLPQGTVREGVILEPDLVVKALKQTLAQARGYSKQVMLSVGGPQTVARPVRLPPMPIEALKKSIQYEASRYLPSAAEEHLVGFDVLEQGEDHLEILLVAAPRSITDVMIEVVEKVGLEVELIELQPFSFWRVVQVAYTGKLPFAYALIDLGGGHTQITVVRGHTLALTRSIPIAGEMLTAALKGYFHYTDEQAFEVKRTLNLEDLITHSTTPQENPPLRLIQPIMDELIREIRRSLNYYQSQYQSAGKNAEGRIERLFLTGGTAQLQGVASYFEHKLGIPTQLFDPFTTDAFVFERFLPEPEASGTAWTTVLGTALVPVEQAMGKHWELQSEPVVEAA